MKKIFLYVGLPIVILGVIAVSLNHILGNVIPFITETQIQGTSLTWYKYDIWGYLQNLKNSFRNLQELTLKLPTRHFQEVNPNMGIGDTNEALNNNMALILDYIIMIINLLLYPFRISFYFIQIILSIIGINTLPGEYNNNPLKWLIDLTYTFKQIQIPYI